MTLEIRNAIITGATLSNADHGVLSSFLSLDYGGTAQGFGGFALYWPPRKDKAFVPNYAGHFIWRCLEIADVSDWKHLAGRTIRAKASHSGVEAIGHIIKDDWFNPKEEFAKMENAGEAKK